MKLSLSIGPLVSYLKMIQDTHHTKFVQDRIFNYPLNHNFEKMTIKALKETQLKWGITNTTNSKYEIIASLNQFIRVTYDSSHYYRIKIKTLNNGCSFWFEKCDFSLKLGASLVKTKVEFNRETYDFKFGKSLYELIYNVPYNEWSSRILFKTNKTVPSLVTSSTTINYYNNIRKACNYIETRSAYINACLFKDFLCNDVIHYIRSLL